MSEQVLNRRPIAVSRARRHALSSGLATLLALGCSGESTVYEVITINGGTAASGGAGAPSTSGGGPVSMAGARLPRDDRVWRRHFRSRPKQRPHADESLHPGHLQQRGHLRHRARSSRDSV